MNIARLWLTDFRNYASAELAPDPDGLTVIRGANGQGKTNLLEAVGWLASLSSFRGAPREALVRTSAERAVVRAEGVREGRAVLVEAELARAGRDRVLVNRQPLRRTRDLLGAFRATVFSPDDLELVRGGPAARRELLDIALVFLAPRQDSLQSDVERVLRQRNTLLRQVEGRLDAGAEATLEVWDSKLSSLGTALAEAREDLVGRLSPEVDVAYTGLSRGGGDVVLTYRRSWEGDLGAALQASRREDLRRGFTSLGPHRDELDVVLDGMPARTQASQGEQRCLALALRLATHTLVTAEVGSPPVLLLDDVLSELDPGRAAALLSLLPPGQALLTTAGPLPEGWAPSLVVSVHDGRISS
ncbi:MAG TPA: DNA replication/repair protein RecF [Acidimicrobiales bacterium]|nr:DNA replication/repair protein RecF [Acidimicrobiales bacterium]